MPFIVKLALGWSHVLHCDAGIEEESYPSW